MLQQIFPRHINNEFHGHVLAIWLLIFIAATKVTASLAYFLSIGGGADSSLSAIGDDVMVAVRDLITQMGMTEFGLSLLLIVVLLRYRAMIPLMYSLILIDLVVIDGIAAVNPMLMEGGVKASDVTLMLTVMSIVGFVFSIRGRSSKEKITQEFLP